MGIGKKPNPADYEELRDDTLAEISVRPKKIVTRNDWLVLATSFFAVMICTGIIGSMSVFYVEFLKDFPDSKAKVALVPSLANGVYDIGGVLAGMMIDSIGCRKSMLIGAVLASIPTAVSFVCHDIVSLILLLGIVCAFGSSIVMLTGMVRVGQQFGHEHPIGTVVISGSHPAGFVLFPQIMPYFIEQYSWRGAVLILSGITLNIIPFGLLATSGMDERKVVQPEEREEEKRGNGCLKKCPLDVELLKNPRFQLFAMSSAFNWGSTYLVHLLIVDFASNRGFSLSEGATLLTIVGTAALFSRVVAGILKRIKRVKNITWYIFFSMAAAVTHSCIPLTSSFTSLACTIIVIGLLFGCRFSFFVLTLLELLPVEKYSQGLGYCLSLWGIGVMTTGPLVGQISTIYGNYDFSYITGGMVGAVSMIPLAIYLIRTRGILVLNLPHTSQTGIEISRKNGN